MKEAPRLIEFRIPPTVSLEGPDQTISRALHDPGAGYSPPMVMSLGWGELK